MEELQFRKSSYSGNRQDCVEVACHPQVGAALRDTKRREDGHLEFPATEWTAFLNATRSENL
ncbi:hypothetical protein LP52_17500 [Streptomonospora alba]|uniref:DUF397 domain-containing protein n=1 Tax=Streptomonospora alba TaxID=183763 RepID=A0A0C2J8K7_9ACTN|nr:DUF397 domain-containing protein [Streptomonospora alba]KIH97831.1 hypothetical protein LP52_17500 [Streptomonospora alba]